MMSFKLLRRDNAGERLINLGLFEHPGSRSAQPLSKSNDVLDAKVQSFGRTISERRTDHSNSFMYMRARIPC